MVAATTPIVGSHVWVEDSEVAWIDSEVLEINGEEVKVSCTSGKTVIIKVSYIYHKDTEVLPSGVDDMTKLAYLHKPGVLENLRSRYDINEIYGIVEERMEVVKARKQRMISGSLIEELKMHC